MIRDKNLNNSFTIGMVYVGTLIGAGFASGQELYQFFGVYGIFGLLGIWVAGIFFSILGYFILRLAYNSPEKKLEELLIPFRSIFIDRLLNGFLLFFLFGIVVVMLAGSGAIFNLQFGVHNIFGSIVMMILVMITTFFGEKGIIKSFSYVVPLLIGGLFLIVGILLSKADWAVLKFDFSPFKWKWLFSALLFMSYNMIAAVSVLVPLGKNTHDKKTAFLGASIGGLLLAVAGFCVVMIMVLHQAEIEHIEVPVVYLAGKISVNLGRYYSIILFAGIYTTVAGCLFALKEKLGENSKLNCRWFYSITLIAGLLLSGIGFSKLVGIIYPLAGYIGIFLIALIVIQTIRRILNEKES